VGDSICATAGELNSYVYSEEFVSRIKGFIKDKNLNVRYLVGPTFEVIDDNGVNSMLQAAFEEGAQFEIYPSHTRRARHFHICLSPEGESRHGIVQEPHGPNPGERICYEYEAGVHTDSTEMGRMIYNFQEYIDMYKLKPLKEADKGEKYIGLTRDQLVELETKAKASGEAYNLLTLPRIKELLPVAA
jgi:hypothetical protein